MHEIDTSPPCAGEDDDHVEPSQTSAFESSPTAMHEVVEGQATLVSGQQSPDTDSAVQLAPFQISAIDP
jgi:hypothetical protein